MSLKGNRIMAKGNRTTAKPHAASAAKATTAPSVAKAADRPYFNVMDNLNQALTELRSTVQALHAVDTHMIGPSDAADAETCRAPLFRLLLADLGLVETAERKAWAVVVAGKGGAL
jgi:hypothetical protein